METKKQKSVLFFEYNEEKLKCVFRSVFEESFEEFLQEKLNREKKEVEFITIPEAARKLKKTVRTIYNWIDKGFVERYYIGDSPYLKISELQRLTQSKRDK